MKQTLLLLIATLAVCCTQNINNKHIVHLQRIENSIEQRLCHFSLDDVAEITKDLSTYNGNTIFQNPTLAKLKEWHNKYGITISLYVQGDFNINSKHAQELVDNSNWLKWGYHGNSDKHKKNDIEKFYKQVSDSIGTDIILDKMPRLHYFAGNKTTCNNLKKKGCTGFLTCDDWSWNSKKRKNYYLNKQNSSLLDKENVLADTISGLYFIKTDFRLEHIAQRWENVNTMFEYYNNNKEQARELIIFSHEWCFNEYIEQADSIFNWAKSNGYIFGYPMNSFNNRYWL